EKLVLAGHIECTTEVRVEYLFYLIGRLYKQLEILSYTKLEKLPRKFPGSGSNASKFQGLINAIKMLIFKKPRAKVFLSTLENLFYAEKEREPTTLQELMSKLKKMLKKAR
ncbi:MAG: hypothetical protein AB1750_12705, partial [Chloroflexota bacterium]